MGVAEKRKVLLRRSRKGEWVEDDPPGFIEYFGAGGKANQKVAYDLLFKSSAAALQKLAKDPRFVGGDIGMMGGLHTWQRDMGYHPHVHFIVPGGGLSPDRSITHRRQILPRSCEYGSDRLRGCPRGAVLH